MMRFEFAVVADLSANVLSACLVIFLVLAGQAARESAARQEARPPLEVGEAFESIRRAPLSGPERVEMLRRLDDGPGPRLDLHADGTRVGTAPSRRAASELTPYLDGAAAGPARLYVFRNEPYAAVVDLLEERALPFREITVPEALRNGGVGAAEDWSPALLALVEQRLEFQPFAAALADLLGGASEASGGGAPIPAGAPPPVASLAERLRAGIALLLSIVAPLAGLALVVAIERGHLRGEWRPDAGERAGSL